MDKLVLKSMQNSKAKQTKKQTNTEKNKAYKRKRGDTLLFQYLTRFLTLIEAPV